jgi:hypothetical protein
LAGWALQSFVAQSHSCSASDELCGGKGSSTVEGQLENINYQDCSWTRISYFKWPLRNQWVVTYRTYCPLHIIWNSSSNLKYFDFFETIVFQNNIGTVLGE